MTTTFIFSSKTNQVHTWLKAVIHSPLPRIKGEARWASVCPLAQTIIWAKLSSLPKRHWPKGLLRGLNCRSNFWISHWLGLKILNYKSFDRIQLNFRSEEARLGNRLAAEILMKIQWVSTILLVGACVADFWLGETIFQRSGALVVGIALSTIIVDRDLEQKESLQRVYSALERQLSTSNPSKIPITIDGRPPTSDQEKFVAEAGLAQILKRAEQAKPELERIKDERLKFTNQQLLWSILGTLVWAFGDWFTNYVWHCPLNISCLP